MIKLSVGEFQWKTTEQVWPFEKALDGSTLYCKEVNMGQLPNVGNLQVAHGISNFNSMKLHDISGLKRNSTYGESYALLGCGAYWNLNPQVYCNALYININVSSDQSYFNSSILRIVYAK